MKNKEKSFTILDTNTRKDEPTLWVFGCSHSFGTGLEKDQKSYGVLLAEELNMPLRVLAWPGSSTHFSLRHLVNSNIKKDDIVVWQLTTVERFSYMEKKLLKEVILPVRPEQKFMEYHTDEQLHFQQLTLLNIGVNYLRAKGVKFVVTSIFSSGTHTFLLPDYEAYPEYCNTDNYEIDKATDGFHAGPLSHQKISQMILKHIQYTNE